MIAARDRLGWEDGRFGLTLIELLVVILADGHASSYSAASIRRQDQGAGLHWRWRIPTTETP